MLNCKNCGKEITKIEVNSTTLIHINANYLGVGVHCDCGAYNQICYGNAYVEAASIVENGKYKDL